jgi:hypothetical protein
LAQLTNFVERLKLAAKPSGTVEVCPLPKGALSTHNMSTHPLPEQPLVTLLAPL